MRPTDSLTAPTTPVSTSSIDLPDSCIGLYREKARDMVVVVGGGGGGGIPYLRFCTPA